MNLNFEIPKKRERKQEKYDFPVLTMEQEPELKGSRRFKLNKAAFELLGFNSDKSIEEKLSIGFPSNNNGIFIIAVSTDLNIDDNYKYLLHKTENTFSNAKLYNAMKAVLGLERVEDDVEFELTRNEELNIITFRELSKEVLNVVQEDNDNTEQGNEVCSNTEQITAMEEVLPSLEEINIQ